MAPTMPHMGLVTPPRREVVEEPEPRGVHAGLGEAVEHAGAAPAAHRGAARGVAAGLPMLGAAGTMPTGVSSEVSNHPSARRKAGSAS